MFWLFFIFTLSLQSLLISSCFSETENVQEIQAEFNTHFEQKRKKIYPQPLKVGDCIALVFPASKITQERIDRCICGLEKRGFKVKLAANSKSYKGYLCGEDDVRLNAFTECWLDPEVKAVWCVLGGYGSGRLLPNLDFNLLCAQPKIFIGMSDITAIHGPLNEHGLVTFLGPCAFQLFMGEDKEKTNIAEESLFSLIQNRNLHKVWDFSCNESVATLQEGVGEGEIVGGNLSLITAHIGTPWQLNTKGKILVLEDIGEETYRIDRMICQLKQAGMLDGLAGLILGSWTDCVPRFSESRGIDLDLDEIFTDWFSGAPYPVLQGFPTGHIPDQQTIPLGCPARLDTYHKKLEILIADPIR